MKIDLVGPRQRGLAMGLNEAVGYGAVGLTALATGYLAAWYGAPSRAVLWFERSAHLPNTEEKDKFNEFMIKTVLPTLPE